MHIPGRKGEVEIEPGRVVSRQRAHQIQNPEKYNEYKHNSYKSKKSKKGTK
jgi:hypothetical protein